MAISSRDFQQGESDKTRNAGTNEITRHPPANRISRAADQSRGSSDIASRRGDVMQFTPGFNWILNNSWWLCTVGRGWIDLWIGLTPASQRRVGRRSVDVASRRSANLCENDHLVCRSRHYCRSNWLPYLVQVTLQLYGYGVRLVANGTEYASYWF